MGIIFVPLMLKLLQNRAGTKFRTQQMIVSFVSLIFRAFAANLSFSGPACPE
jgi:hypothetical protein